MQMRLVTIPVRNVIGDVNVLHETDIVMSGETETAVDVTSLFYHKWLLVNGLVIPHLPFYQC